MSAKRTCKAIHDEIDREMEQHANDPDFDPPMCGSCGYNEDAWA